MKRRVAKKNASRAERYWRRELKRHQGYHALAVITVGVARMMAALDAEVCRG